jgi:hypothetical protein
VFYFCGERVIEAQILYAVHISDIISKCCVITVLNINNFAFLSSMLGNFFRRSMDKMQRVNKEQQLPTTFK